MLPERHPHGPRDTERVPGETHCDFCGASAEVVGPMGPIAEHPEMCGYCARERQAVLMLDREAERLLTPWVQACINRGVDPQEISDIVTTMIYKVVAPPDPPLM